MAQMPNQQVVQQQENTTVSVGNWIGTFILSAIPIVGLVLLFVWAFGSNTIQSKKNWARAALILALIGIVLAVIWTIVFGSFIGSLFSGYYSF